MMSGYQNFQIALIHICFGYFGCISRIEIRRLCRSCSKYVEFGTYWHGFRRHGRAWTDWFEEKITLFVSSAFFEGCFPFLVCFFHDFAAARLWPRPRNFWIKFCTESPTRFPTISRGLTSGTVLSAMSVAVSRPTALTPLQRSGLTIRNRSLNNIRTPFEQRAVPSRWTLSRYWSRDTPVGATTVQLDRSIWMYVGGVDVDIDTMWKLVENIEGFLWVLGRSESYRCALQS